MERIADSSESKHIALPVKLKPSFPEIFATAPSLARFPYKMTKWLSFFTGLSTVLMIF